MRKILVFMVLMGAGLLIPFTPVHADMAPPAQPPGSLPGPAGTTMVQMVSETVDITIDSTGALYYKGVNQRAVNAQVQAQFTMKNMGKRDEEMKARFPLSSFHRWGDGYSNNPEIQNLKIWVDQIAVQWTVSEEPQSPGKESTFIRWANFSIRFPVGKPVAVDMTYSMQSTGWLPQAEFGYILETGAGWYGPIGSGVINLTLPFDAVAGENVNLSESSTGGQTNGTNTIRWEFTNLEPTAKDNWHVQLINPETWQAILSLREKSTEEPGNSTWLSQLIEKYSTIIYGKGFWVINSGYIELALECSRAYEKSIELKPEDAKGLQEYAGLLYAIYQNPDRSKESKPGIEEIHDALNRAYLLDPENLEVSGLYQEISRAVTQFPPLGIKSTPVKTREATLTPPNTKSIFEPIKDLFKDEEQMIFYGMVAVALLILGFTVGIILKKNKRK